MALSGVQIVDTDRSTNLFVLMSDDGSANSAWGSVVTKFALGGGITVTAPQDAERFEHPGMDGGFTTFSRRSLGEVSWRQYVGATSEANLRLGIGRLTDLITRGGYFLRLVAGSTRLLAFEPSSIQPFSGKDLELHDIYQQFAYRQGLDIKLVCQPYWEGPEVTSSAVDVPNNPANGTSGARVFALSGVTGDLPTPAKVRVKIAAESKTLSTSAAADDIVDCTAHGFQVGDAIVFTSLTGGSGLTAGTTYYVTSTSFAANTFRPALTPSGTAINFTTDITAGAVQAAGTVERVHIAARARNTRASSYFSTYLSDTAWFNCESSGRNWTIALSNDTSSTADTEASGGNMARCTHTNDPTAWKRRVHATRTTNLDSLRGSWDVYLRCAPEDLFAFEAQVKWSPSVTDAPPFDLPVVVPGEAAGGTPQTAHYMDFFMGTINIPDDASTLAGLTIDIWTRQTDLGSAADLDMDLVQFFPHDRQGTVVVPIASTTVFSGADLDSPFDDPVGGTAGVVSGTTLRLDTTTDNAGTRPITGTVLPAGLYRVTWRFQASDFDQIDLLVRNVTAASNTFSESAVPLATGENTLTRTFVADGTSAYQEQVDNPGTANKVTVVSITRERMALLARDESARTEPSIPRVDRLDSSANLAGYLGTEAGGVPIVVDPGDNHIMVRPEEVAQIRMVKGESRLERISNVTVSYFPRYAF